MDTVHRISDVFAAWCARDTPGARFERSVAQGVVGVLVAGGDRDCSAAVIDAWETVLPGSTAGATYTGDRREEFLSTGLWKWHPMGDIYLNERAHAALCLSAVPDMLARFPISELGTVDGREGDQTGWESDVRPYSSLAISTARFRLG